MKAIIESFTDKPVWIENESNPYALCMLGKYMIDFSIDYCLLCKITDITFVFEKYEHILLNHIKKYLGSEINVHLKLRDNFPESNYYDDGDDVIVFRGCCLICYDKRTNGKSEDLEKIRKRFADLVSNKGIEIRGKAPINIPDVVALNYPTAADFFDVTMELLKNYIDLFSINGYAVENNIHMGMFDVIVPDTVLIPNVIISNNVMIGRNCKIGPNVIIGNDSVIADGCVIKNSLITPLSYVGEKNIENKIIYKHSIIEPSTNKRTLLAEDLVYGTPREHFAIFFNIMKCFWALLLLMLLLPFAIPFLFLGTPKEFLIIKFKKNKREVKVKLFLKDKSSLRDKYFFKLSQDKVPKLILAILGKLEIVGDSLISAKYPQKLKYYGEYFNPGVFSCPDSYGVEDVAVRPVDDLRYKNRRTIIRDFRLVFRALIFRLIT